MEFYDAKKLFKKKKSEIDSQGKALSVRLIRSVPSWLVESFKAFSRCRRDLIGSPLVCMSKFPRL